MGASATIAGQNLGAGNPGRAAEGVKVASMIGLGVAVAVGSLFLMIPGYLYTLKVSGPETDGSTACVVLHPKTKTTIGDAALSPRYGEIFR
jgi:Na+-driven multidrug efflux pump